MHRPRRTPASPPGLAPDQLSLAAKPLLPSPGRAGRRTSPAGIRDFSGNLMSCRRTDCGPHLGEGRKAADGPPRGPISSIQSPPFIDRGRRDPHPGRHRATRGPDEGLSQAISAMGGLGLSPGVWSSAALRLHEASTGGEGLPIDPGALRRGPGRLRARPGPLGRPDATAIAPEVTSRRSGGSSANFARNCGRKCVAPRFACCEG